MRGLWDSFSVEEWQTLPAISGTLATEKDVNSGRAVFYLEDPNEIGAEPYNRLEMPHCAILLDGDTGKETPVVIIQAEKAEELTYIGYRFLSGGNGVCLLPELELLDGPDDRFLTI
jgi:hypothetical protein